MVELSIVDVNELREMIGKESKPISVVVEKEAIRKFARAVEDENPLYLDEEYAKGTRFAGIVAPEGMFLSAEFNNPPEPIACPTKRILDGGGNWAFYRRVRPGDTITFSKKLLEVAEREGRIGKMYLITSEIKWRDQNGNLVAKAQTTLISY